MIKPPHVKVNVEPALTAENTVTLNISEANEAELDNAEGDANEQDVPAEVVLNPVKVTFN